MFIEGLVVQGMTDAQRPRLANYGDGVNLLERC